MPIVKSIAIHDNVRATLRYILNPEKTEGMFLCNSLNCFTNAEDAYKIINVYKTTDKDVRKKAVTSTVQRRIDRKTAA